MFVRCQISLFHNWPYSAMVRPPTPHRGQDPLGHDPGRCQWLRCVGWLRMLHKLGHRFRETWKIISSQSAAFPLLANLSKIDDRLCFTLSNDLIRLITSHQNWPNQPHADPREPGPPPEIRSGRAKVEASLASPRPNWLNHASNIAPSLSSTRPWIP